MRKDFKYAQRPQAAFGRPKDPGTASGRLKILYDYISNNRKILLDTIWIMYSICDKQKNPRKSDFFKNTHPELSPTLVTSLYKPLQGCSGDRAGYPLCKEDI